MSTIEEIQAQLRERINKALDEADRSFQEALESDLAAAKQRQEFVQDQLDLSARLENIREGNETRPVTVYYDKQQVGENEVVSSPNRLLILRGMMGNIAVKAYSGHSRHYVVNWIGRDTLAMGPYEYGDESTIMLARIIVCVALGWKKEDFSDGEPDYADGNMYNLTDENLVIGGKTLAQILKGEK